MSYIERLQNNALLADYPFEHIYRNVDHQSFLSRLATERNQYDAGLLCSGAGVFAKLIVFVEKIWDEQEAKKLQSTLSLWALQSCPNIKGVIVPTESNVGDVANWLASSSDQEEATALYSLSGVDSLSLDDADYFIFARPGDLHHPSLVYTIATSVQSGFPDIFNWNFQVLSENIGEPIAFNRLPNVERYTLWHQNYFASAAAFKSEVVRHSTSLLQTIIETDAHLLHLELLEKNDLVWRTLPVYLQLTPDDRLSQPALQQSLDDYKAFFSSVAPEFDFSVVDIPRGEYHLTPKQKPKVISVIIPFRDKPELTLQCVESLMSQTISGKLEIVLVNNQSIAENVATIASGMAGLSSKNPSVCDAKIVDYNKPFNHSQQCNLGITNSTGDVIILLNNDAAMTSATTLEELSAWALLPDVGTVGCRIEDLKGNLVCAGIKSRINCGFDYNSGVEESRDQSYSGIVRETFANTFAFAVMAREVFEKVGPLNGLEFPNGYNDVEYNLRIRKEGLKNIYIGHLVVIHQPGTSRGKCDEIIQKVLVRERFPEMFSDSLFQLENDAHLVNRVKKLAKRGRVSMVKGAIYKSSIVQGKVTNMEDSTPIEVDNLGGSSSARDSRFKDKIKALFRHLMID